MKEARELQRDSDAIQKENEELRSQLWRAMIAEEEAKEKEGKANAVMKQMEEQVNLWHAHMERENGRLCFHSAAQKTARRMSIGSARLPFCALQPHLSFYF